MILVLVVSLLNLLFPCIGSECPGLKLILQLLGSKDTQGFNQSLFSTIGHRWVLLFNLLQIENLLYAIGYDTSGSLESS